MNYKYRMHDPRIGRFFAIDPLAPEYPHNSPYAFSENVVIDHIELEGLEKAHYTIKMKKKDGSFITLQKYTNRQAHLKIGNQQWKVMGGSQIVRVYNENGDLISEKISGETYFDYQINQTKEKIRKMNSLQQNEKLAYFNQVEKFMLYYPEGGTAQQLIYHYAYGKGEEYTLTHQQMLEVFPPNMKPSLSVEEIKTNGKYSGKKEFTTAGAGGTLGRFYYRLEGNVETEIIDGVEKQVFRGSLIFEDDYDFNPDEKGLFGSSRGFIPELKTRIAKYALPGEKFKIKGSIAVIQYGDGPMQFAATGEEVNGDWSGGNGDGQDNPDK